MLYATVTEACIWPSTSCPADYYAALLLKEGAAYCVALCLSVCPSVCPSVPLLLPSVTSRHLANYNDARAEGRISYGHLGRTSSLLLLEKMPILSLHLSGCRCVANDDVNQGISISNTNNKQ